MLFSSSVFLLYFLPLLVLCYFLIPKRFLPARNLVLLVFSIVFYGFGGVRYLGLLTVCILSNYLGALLLHQFPGRKKLFLTLTLVVNLGLLGWFKYAGFLAGTIAALGVPIPVPHIILPIGISFFTFQGVSYVIDVYRGDAAVQKNPLNVALYVSLFPQLVAGPIVRYTTVEHEIGQRSHSLEEFSAGLTRFMFGFGKKMLLANVMGEITDPIHALVGQPSLTASLAWIGAVTFSLQVYFDFSAYSDMAIGLGRMFGFHFEENFDYPYLASSLTNHWQRWHISLTTWFRDYVYFPLGGSRCSQAKSIRNTIIVWFLTGLWHGADWSFVLWGLYSGALVLLEKYALGRVLKHVPLPLRVLYTFTLVVLGAVMFRADTMGDAVQYYRAMFGGGALTSNQSIYYLRQYWPELLLCVAACFPIKPRLEQWIEAHGENRAVYLFGLVAPKVLALAVFFLGYIKLVYGSFNPFIYFQF